MAQIVIGSHWSHRGVSGILMKNASSFGIEEEDLLGVSGGDEDGVLGRDDHFQLYYYIRRKVYMFIAL